VVLVMCGTKVRRKSTDSNIEPEFSSCPMPDDDGPPFDCLACLTAIPTSGIALVMVKNTLIGLA
jgi:hypothetical protein